MRLIPIYNKYSIDISKYEKLKVGDEASSKMKLLRDICYPYIPVNKETGNEKRLRAKLDKFIGYENIKGSNKIIITSLKPVSELESIFNMKVSDESRIRYDERNYLLDYIVLFKDDNVFTDSSGYETVYLTTGEIIRHSEILTDFYYDYAKIYYDKIHASAEDIEKLDEFIITHSISDRKYFIDTMDMLNEIIYAQIFSMDNIMGWAKRCRSAERVLFQNDIELDGVKSKYLIENYIEPLIEGGIHPKSITKLSNRNYATDKKISPKQHKWFFFKYKFVRPDRIVSIDDTELNYYRENLNGKIIERLKAKTIECKANQYHIKNKSNLDYIIKKIAL